MLFFVSGGAAGLTHRDVMAYSCRLSSEVEKQLSQVGLLPGKSAMAKPGAFKSEIGMMNRTGRTGGVWYNKRANPCAACDIHLL